MCIVKATAIWHRIIVPVAGRIRNKPEVDDSAADAVLSLNIISAKNLKSSHNSSRYAVFALHIWQPKDLFPVKGLLNQVLSSFICLQSVAGLQMLYSPNANAST